MNETIAKWLLLSEIPKFGPSTLLKMINKFGDVESIYSASETELLDIPRVVKNSVKIFIDKRNDENQLNIYSRKVDEIKQNNINVLPVFDKNYPENLRRISNPPPILFTRGNFTKYDEDKTIAIVGTREASTFGLKKSYEISSNLAEEGYTIVSGLALGIDTQAHRGALDQTNGRTIAVLGHGIGLDVFPPENMELLNEIYHKGMACTEYPPNTKWSRHTFKSRDRIISGLAKATLVIECSVKSGTMITADSAIKQKRPLFVVRPDSPTDILAQGPLKLIKEHGAKPISSYKEITEHLTSEL